MEKFVYQINVFLSPSHPECCGYPRSTLVFRPPPAFSLKCICIFARNPKPETWNCCNEPENRNMKSANLQGTRNPKPCVFARNPKHETGSLCSEPLQKRQRAHRAADRRVPPLPIDVYLFIKISIHKRLYFHKRLYRAKRPSIHERLSAYVLLTQTPLFTTGTWWRCTAKRQGAHRTANRRVALLLTDVYLFIRISIHEPLYVHKWLCMDKRPYIALCVRFPKTNASLTYYRHLVAMHCKNGKGCTALLFH